MQTIKYRNKRKAVSPIIATLILIVITVAAGVVIYYFVSGYLSASTASVASQQANQLSIISASWIGGSSKTLSFSIQNSGTVSVTFTISLVAVYNVNTGAQVANSTSISPSPSFTLSPGQAESFTASLNAALSPGTYKLVVVTSVATLAPFTFEV
jgi:archaeal flagellin N-terminal-like domain